MLCDPPCYAAHLAVWLAMVSGLTMCCLVRERMKSNQMDHRPCDRLQHGGSNRFESKLVNMAIIVAW